MANSNGMDILRKDGGRCEMNKAEQISICTMSIPSIATYVLYVHTYMARRRSGRDVSTLLRTLLWSYDQEHGNR